MSNIEQDEALRALKLNDGQILLDRIATREHLESQTAINHGVARMALERVKFRVTGRHCLVVVVVLAISWTAFAFAVLR